MLVDYRGGAKSRAGTALVQQAGQNPTNGRPPRIIGWQFNNQQGYVLEFGDHYLRFHFQGSTVTETPIAITAVTQANPAVVSVANSFSPGDWVVFSGIGGMTILNSQYLYRGSRASPALRYRCTTSMATPSIPPAILPIPAAARSRASTRSRAPMPLAI